MTNDNVPLGRLEQCKDVLREHADRPVLLVADRLAYEQSGARERLADMLRHRRMEVFCDFQPNPQWPDVLLGIQRLRANPESLVIAVGGGTAIDLAKLICGVGAQEDPLRDELALDLVRTGKLAQARRNPLLAIPTTAGTGSEATQFAVVYADGKKSSVSDPSLLPDHVILDPTLTISLPRQITVSTGLDALAQAIESLWSVQATEESQQWAEEALRGGLQHLERAADAPTWEDRAAMMKAAHLAGRAINVSKTTAPHALSYTMTSRHGVPHGMAVAISLSSFMRFNAKADENSVTHPGGVKELNQAFQRIVAAFKRHDESVDSVESAARAWDAMLARVGCPTHLCEWEITEDRDYDRLIDDVNLQRLANNPRRVTPSELRTIVMNIR